MERVLWMSWVWWAPAVAGRGDFQRGCGGTGPATPVGWALRAGWAGERICPPSLAPFPADPLQLTEMPSVPIFPPAPVAPQPDPQCPPCTPHRTCKAGGPERCLLPQLSSGMPGLWFQGTQLTSPHRQWPRTAVISSLLSQEFHHTPTPPSRPPRDPPTPGLEGFEPLGAIPPQADVMGLDCPFPTLYSGGSHCHGRDMMCWQEGTSFP